MRYGVIIKKIQSTNIVCETYGLQMGQLGHVEFIICKNCWAISITDRAISDNSSSGTVMIILQPYALSKNVKFLKM